MPSDPRATQARELHRRAAEHEQRAGDARAQRDEIVRALCADGWQHRQVADAIGCSPHLVTSIVMRRVGRRA